MKKNKGPFHQMVSYDEKHWKAREDARVLAEAKVILKDKERVNAAAKAAQELVDKAREEAKAMSSVARKGRK